MYVCNESRKITQNILEDKAEMFNIDNIVYLRNFENIWSTFKWRFKSDRGYLSRGYLDSELIFVENIRCLAIDVFRVLR
jgi:hypothetical protein